MIVTLFIAFFNMGISASIVACLLILWRTLTKKFIPNKFYYVLWGTLFFRLMFPFSFQSAISAFNVLLDLSQSSVGGSYIVTMEYVDVLQAQEVTAYNQNNFLFAIALVWMLVSISLIVYWVFIYAQTHKRLQYAIISKEALYGQVQNAIAPKSKFSVYVSNHIETPIVIGFCRPRIILPQNISFSTKEKEFVLAHEIIHIKRRDQFTKALMFFVCAFHWYNPFVWVSFYLFNEDIETSCDQAVLNYYGAAHKKEYAEILVDCADKNNSMKMGYLAFSKKNVLHRVNTILNYNELSMFKVVLFSIITFLISLSVSANPIIEYNYGYVPQTRYIDAQSRSEIKTFVNDFVEDLNAADAQEIAQKSTADVDYFLPLYSVFSSDFDVDVEKIFYTSKDGAVAYLKLNNANQLFNEQETHVVLEVDSSSMMNGLYVQNLQSYSKYETIHEVDYGNEAVMLCQKMIKYGLTSGEMSIENAKKITLFCMDIAYDRQSNSYDTALKAQTVEAIAQEFFEITDYTNMRSTQYYDGQSEAYQYDSNAGQYFEYQITNLEITEGGAIVTVEFYLDPLQTQIEKIVKYTFQRGN